MIDIKVPTIGESISEVTLVKWLKNDGEYVNRDEVIAELESEKATFEVNAEQAGVLKTMGKEGDTLNIGDLLAQIDETAAKSNGSEGKEKNIEQGTRNKEQGSKEQGNKTDGQDKEKAQEKQKAQEEKPQEKQTEPANE